MAVIEIPDEQARLLEQRSAGEGLTLDAWLRKLAGIPAQEGPKRPFKDSLGLLAEFGPAPSAEEIDEARRELWGLSAK